MKFKQVVKQWLNTFILAWDEMDKIEKWIVLSVTASILLLTISLWRVL